MMNRRSFLAAVAAGAALCSLPGQAAPSLPGKLVLVKNVGENRVLFLLDPNTEKQTQLSARKRQEDGPCLSPDGKTLLFAAFEGKDWMIWSMDLATRQARVLVKKVSWPVCWLPDGRFVGILDMDLWICDVDGKPQKSIAQPQCMPVTAALTAQGDLVYSDGMEPTNLRVVNLGTGADRRLAQGYGPVALEGGRTILYQDGSSFYRIPIAGGQRQVVGGLPKGASNFCAAPDGKHLVCTAGAGLVVLGSDLRPVKTIRLGGSINSLTWGP